MSQVPFQCRSCPFKVGNDDEFGAIVNRLRRTAGMPEVTGKQLIPCTWHARASIKRDIQYSGDFACHHTVYDKAGKFRPVSEHRQCRGATKWFREQLRNRAAKQTKQ